MLRDHRAVGRLSLAASPPRLRHISTVSPCMNRAPSCADGEGEDVVKSVMTKLSLAVMAVAGVLVSAPAATAGDMVKAKVPFAFVVNGVELPPGDYVLSRDTNQPDLIEISTAAGQRRALALTQAAASDADVSAEPKLEFERVGDQVFLTQITMGQGVSREIRTPAPAEDLREKQ